MTLLSDLSYLPQTSVKIELLLHRLMFIVHHHPYLGSINTLAHR
ncbi:hypothetical protein [Shewanella sp.]